MTRSQSLKILISRQRFEDGVILSGYIVIFTWQRCRKGKVLKQRLLAKGLTSHENSVCCSCQDSLGVCLHRARLATLRVVHLFGIVTVRKRYKINFEFIILLIRRAIEKFYRRRWIHIFTVDVFSRLTPWLNVLIKFSFKIYHLII